MKILDSAPAQILVDPATESALILKKEDALKKEAIERKAAHRDNIQKWMEDTSRVELFKNSNYKLLNDSNICIEVCTSYIKDKEQKTLIYDTMYGLTVNEELSMLLFPYAKDLSTGDIYTISDAFTMKQFNPAYAEWHNRASEKPSYREEVEAPAKILFYINEVWNTSRFFLDKVEQFQSPNDFFTFIVPKSVLQTKVKTVSKKDNPTVYPSNSTKTYQ